MVMLYIFQGLRLSLLALSENYVFCIKVKLHDTTKDKYVGVLLYHSLDWNGIVIPSVGDDMVRMDCMCSNGLHEFKWPAWVQMTCKSSN